MTDIAEEDLQKNDALKRRYITLADRDIRQNGYKIHSTINKEIYDAMQQVVADYNYYGSDRTKKVTDPETGETQISSRSCGNWCHFD